MAHQHLIQTGYSQLVERLNRFPQGATPSELLNKILAILFHQKEAELVSLLPIKPFRAKDAAHIWKMKETDARKVLDNLAERALMLDVQKNGETIYILPPPMAGFFEFSLMRIRKDIDQKVLSELFYQYMNVEEDFIRDLFTEGETRLGRTFINENTINDEQSLYVLDYERATEVIKSATHIGIGTCYCRHKMKHLGRACGRPMEICMTFNTSAASLIRHDNAREAGVTECLELLHMACENNLVQFGENVRERVNFICNCCGCCCEAMIAARRFAILKPVHTTNFLPLIRNENCNACGKCVDVCPVSAMGLISANDPFKSKAKTAKVDDNICLGCGLCARACSNGCIRMVLRGERVVTPLNSIHKAVVMAIERGKLQNLIFDNHVLFSHRAFNSFLGVVLNLSPIKQLMACRQIKSRFFEQVVRQIKK